MSPQLSRFVAATLSDRIVQTLQDRQHLRPHASTREALEAASAIAGFCTAASDQALAILQLDGSILIGRLTSCQLSQLGRAIHRIWLQRSDSAPPHPQNPPQHTAPAAFNTRT